MYSLIYSAHDFNFMKLGLFIQNTLHAYGRVDMVKILVHASSLAWSSACAVRTDDEARMSDVVCFLLGNSPASEFYMPTFRNTLFHLHREVGVKKMEQSVPKRGHIKFRRRGITQKKSNNIQNTAKV